MHLHVTHDSAPGRTRRIARLGNVPGEKEVEIFFDMEGVTVGPPAVLDGFVFGVIFYAMRIGEDLRVGGPMTLGALLNLSEFQEAWTLWRPHLYHKIRIIPDSIVDRGPATDKKAIAAFSGGVDSIFTILRHKTKALGNASYPLNDTVLMVHGFDVPLAAPDQLESLKKRTRPFLEELGLKLLTIRTNLKELGLQDWEDSFMSQLACCLNNYSEEFCYALAASSEAYNGLVLPWGSNPATDYLLSGDTMQLVHDGAGYSRTEKVARIAADKTATLVAKVCWEGQETSRNCGECEKCIRTQLNFKAVGVEHAPCFDRPLDSRLIETMNLRNDAQANELKSIYAYATKAGIIAGWVQTVAQRIDRYDNLQSKHPALARRTPDHQEIITVPDPPQLLFLADVYGTSSPHVGDEAMLEANVSLFRRLLPGCGISVAAGPGWNGDHLGARALPRMEFPAASEAERDALLQAPHPVSEWASPTASAALSCDALIISGGGNLCSKWAHLLYERLAMARLAASKGIPVITLGQTLGPELGARDRELLTELLKISVWTGLRETYSYSLALELGADPETLSYQVDDATFLTPLPARTDGLTESDRPWIVVTVQPVGEPDSGNPVIVRLADSLRTIANTVGAELVFIPHVNFPNGGLGDSAFGEAIQQALNGDPPLHIFPVLPAAQTMWLTQQASLVVSTRYHPLVFALAGAVPALGLWTDEYTRRKLQGVLIHAGRLGDAMSLEEALAGELTAKALRLWHSRASLREELRSRITTWRREEEIRFVKLGYRLQAGIRHRPSIPVTQNSNDLQVASPETAFEVLKSQKIVQENEIRKLKAQLLEETACSKRFCDGLAEDRMVTELEMAGLKNELIDAKARLASAHLSRSWRLTAPLRWCDEIQRRVVGRLQKVSRADD